MKCKMRDQASRHNETVAKDLSKDWNAEFMKAVQEERKAAIMAAQNPSKGTMPDFKGHRKIYINAKGVTKNSARCKFCGDVLMSKIQRQIVRCRCGNLMIDGGLAILIRYHLGSVDWQDAFEELSLRPQLVPEIFHCDII